MKLRALIGSVAAVGIACAALAAGPASASVGSNDTVYTASIVSTECNNCATTLSTSTWIDAYPHPVVTSLVQRYQCTYGMKYYQYDADSSDVAGVYYASSAVTIPALSGGYGCGGSITWVLGMVNGT